MNTVPSLVLVRAAAVTLAVPARADGVHGAVGINPHNGFVAFESRCAALARPQNEDAYGIGIEATPASAQATALGESADSRGAGSNIHDTYCAPHSLLN